MTKLAIGIVTLAITILLFISQYVSAVRIMSQEEAKANFRQAITEALAEGFKTGFSEPLNATMKEKITTATEDLIMNTPADELPLGQQMQGGPTP